ELTPNAGADKGTAIGASTSLTPGSPSCPTSLAPKHQTEPSWRRAHECSAAAATSTQLLSEPTRVGTTRLSLSPTPSRPRWLPPQQKSAPRTTAQLWSLPASTITRLAPPPASGSAASSPPESPGGPASEPASTRSPAS